ncbi:hypothetical protein ACS0TY_005711 [Phlomoides rotata]
MANSSRTSTPVRCFCRKEAIVVTSSKDANVGRRFFGCENYSNIGYCKFFRWIDQPMCERAREIIPGLLKKMNDMRGELRNAQHLAQKLKETVSVLEQMNGRLKKDVRNLKNENSMLKDEEKKGRNMSIKLKFCILCFAWLQKSELEKNRAPAA